MSAENKNRILLVEDDQDTRSAMAMLFEMEGFEVLSARDGREAYLKAQAERPDLIVTDINMPVVSGLDLIRLIRADCNLQGVPIIAMSAVGKQYLNRAKELGAVEVCQKPIEFDTFLSMIAQVVSARRKLSRNHRLPERGKNQNRH